MNKDMKVWFGAAIRGLIVGGLAFFGTSFSAGSLSVGTLESAFIAGGGYMFVELANYYGIHLKKFDKRFKYHFLLLPT